MAYIALSYDHLTPHARKCINGFKDLRWRFVFRSKQETGDVSLGASCTRASERILPHANNTEIGNIDKK
ncbi:hypothetical protein SAMN05421665_0971 [Yoonia rosea]|uniref:Uncharacterized protein n=1 Tax=Yoonia rosea TaxID=287098 RepID=A0A1R3WQ36_9RHOB|nr:hypothetical protein SAMN05421665_0971 [Yoonia rosea]